MSGLTIRPASRAEAKPIIGLYGESGSGKTTSALYLARGFVGPSGRIGMIETESGRGEAAQDEITGLFDVIPMRDDFSPKRFGEALTLAEQAKWDALIVDSGSHEWEGVGGVLHMAAENQKANKKGPIVWQVPKIDHQRHFVGRLLQSSIPLVILCMRAKYPMHEEKKSGGGKEWVRSTELEPKQSEDILFEMFVHGWIDRDAHAFHGTKYTRKELAQVMRSGEPISVATGAALAEWSRGGKPNHDALDAAILAMRNAGTMDELKAVTPQLATLSDADKAIARKLYAERRDLLAPKDPA